jgi:hypothetical protein
MKNIKITVFILLGLLLSSCDDFLDKQPDDMLTLDEVFARKQTTEEYLANVYSYIPDYANADSYNLTSASDEAKFSWNGVPGYNINMGNWGPTNIPYHIWPDMYKGIRSASVFINRVDECSELTESVRTKYKAEARFLRAYFYHLLMRQYGSVVIMDELIPVDASPKDVQKPRNTYDECVAYLVSEIDKTITDLPDKITDEYQFGRPDKIVALALKSQALLYAASPLFNGNTDYASFRNLDGTQLISQTYDSDKWKEAADAAKTVIDLMSQGLYKKYDEDGNYDPLVSYRDIYFDNWNQEIIWGKYTGSGAGSWEWNGGIIQLGNAYANYGVTQQLVDAYFMDNGYLPISGYNSDGSPIINPNSGYVESGVTENEGKYTIAGICNMYANRDPRFYACVTFNGAEWVWHGDDGNSRWFAEFFATGKDGLQGGARGQDPTHTGYVIRKYNDPSSDVNLRKLRNNAVWIHFRLAEFYLNYAEALNEYNPGDPDIIKYLNLIRERAGIPQYGTGTNALPIPANQEEMRNLIRAERRVELAFEMHRIFDVRRWKIAPTTDGGPMWGMNMNAGTSWADPAFYERTIFETRTFEKKHYFWPIAQSTLDRNKALVQNPGW